MRTLPLLALLLLAAPARADSATPAPAGDRSGAAEIEAVKAWLLQHHPGAHWQFGPLRLDSPEIRAAYPGSHFYTVRSNPPLPPGAVIEEAINGYNRAMAAYNAAHYITATVRIDPKSRISEVGDCNSGLSRPKGEKEARAAGAAALTIAGVGFAIGPTEIHAAELELRRDGGGYQLTVSRAWSTRAVSFDAQGRCEGLGPEAAMPMPPSAAPAHLF